jgi:SAM-dependent methyltransferase
MATDPMLDSVRTFYEGKFEAHGATPQGLDFGSLERQQLCFSQLTKIWSQPAEAATLNDFGCGYGALITFLEAHGHALSAYTGYDISAPMIQSAAETFKDNVACRFTTDYDSMGEADFTIASGVFNIKLDAPVDEWRAYILRTLDGLWKISRRGLSFNILTSYSDPEKMRDDLYYADPTFFFDYCKRNYARDVALLHDYGVYEFTILVRRP